MRFLSKVVELNPKGPHWGRGVMFLDVALVPLVVLAAIGKEQYLLSAVFGAALTVVADPGGSFRNRRGLWRRGPIRRRGHLFPNLTEDDITRRYKSGSHVTAKAADGAVAAGNDLLFLIGRDGHLRPVTTSRAPTPEPGDTAVVLGPAGSN